MIGLQAQQRTTLAARSAWTAGCGPTHAVPLDVRSGQTAGGHATSTSADETACPLATTLSGCDCRRPSWTVGVFRHLREPPRPRPRSPPPPLRRIQQCYLLFRRRRPRQLDNSGAEATSAPLPPAGADVADSQHLSQIPSFGSSAIPTAVVAAGAPQAAGPAVSNGKAKTKTKHNGDERRRRCK